MSHYSLVSESATSFLNLELIAYVINREINNNKNSLENGELNAMRDLEALGVLVGFRVSERLLYREFSFGASTPLEVARFVGQQVWRALFGKKVDRMKHMDNIYFCLIDTDFCWLKGFPKLQGVDRVVSTTLVYPPGYSKEATASSEAQTCINQRVGGVTNHKDVLVYAVGVLRGTVQGIFPSSSVKVFGAFHKDRETHFVLDFRPQVT